MHRSSKQLAVAAAITLMLVSSAIAVRSARAETAHGQSAAVAAKLDEIKLKICQRRETVIKRIMGRIATRGGRQLEVFTKIAERTEKFYDDKGKTVSNYAELVAQVGAKKAAAEETLDEINSDASAFACNGDDPHGVGQAFKDDLKKEIKALKAYKTAVKNLIVGVKSAQGQASSSQDSSSNDEESN